MRKFFVVFAILAFSLFAASSASAYSNAVSYSGQGLTADGFGGYDLNTELCGVANGADVDGPYLLFVLTATGAKSADITIGGTTYPMVKSGNGAFKYVSAWMDPSSLPTISASYDGKVKNAQLVISHGCRPFNAEKPVWCSPGFWRNADDAAWVRTGATKTDLFNLTVVPAFYATTLIGNPTLGQSLTDVAYKSGTLTDGPYGLTPFNATGAFLTDSLDGFSFSTTDYAAGSDTCPLDSHGNLKVPTAT